MDDYQAAFINRIDKLAFDMGWSKKRELVTWQLWLIV